jgi:hypothetical protein
MADASQKKTNSPPSRHSTDGRDRSLQPPEKESMAPIGISAQAGQSLAFPDEEINRRHGQSGSSELRDAWLVYENEES